jgi:hypothetical protein
MSSTASRMADVTVGYSRSNHSIASTWVAGDTVSKPAGFADGQPPSGNQDLVACPGVVQQEVETCQIVVVAAGHAYAVADFTPGVPDIDVFLAVWAVVDANERSGASRFTPTIHCRSSYTSRSLGAFTIRGLYYERRPAVAAVPAAVAKSFNHFSYIGSVYKGSARSKRRSAVLGRVLCA